MLSCNGLVLNYAVIIDKTRSKIQIVQDIAKKLPVPPVPLFFLCNSWYTSTDVIHALTESGFSVIGASKTNKVLYPAGYKMQAAGLATYMKEMLPSIHSVTMKKGDIVSIGMRGPSMGLQKQLCSLAIPVMHLGIRAERVTYLYQCEAKHIPLEDILALAGRFCTFWGICPFIAQYLSDMLYSHPYLHCC